MSSFFKVSATDSIFSYDASYTLYTSTKGSGYIYQNKSTIKPMYVSIDVLLGTGGSNSFFVQCDSSSNPTTYIVQYSSLTLPNAFACPLTFIVPPLYYYKVTGGSWSYLHWIEYIV